MNIKSILKIIAAALIFLVVFIVYPNYADDRRIEKSREKLSAENINLELEGYKFGITKNEFFNNYGNILDSLVREKHSSNYHSDINPKFIKTFQGLTVLKEEISFKENIFERLFIKTDIFTHIKLDIKNSSYENFMQLKSYFDKYELYSHSQSDSKSDMDASYYYVVNKYLEISLEYNKFLNIDNNKQSEYLSISFGIMGFEYYGLDEIFK